MNKEECIKRYGKAAYKKRLQQSRDWAKVHRKEANVISNRWRAANPEKAKTNNQEHSHKGGKYYERHLEHDHTGLRGERNRVRVKHANQYRPFNQIIAPESQIHHEWILDIADFRGVALVEKDQHMHGYVDVIKILEGKTTLFTEKEINKK